MLHRRWMPMAAVLVLIGSAAHAQGSVVTPAQAAPFMGTWAIAMTEPDALKGSQQTVRIGVNNGVLTASVQVGKFPPNRATGIFKDGEMLVLTLSHEAGMLENGAPIWAVISLTLDGDTMKTAQMLERSQTIKRGTGRKQPE